MTNFVLDERLESESIAVTTLGLCQLRLRDDMRWPWLILIPQRPSIIEQHDLAPLDQTTLSFETNQVSKALKDLTACTKINIGALGNVVRQLHVHVVARNEGDAGWPGPIWGVGERVPYRGDGLQRFAEQIRGSLQIMNKHGMTERMPALPGDWLAFTGNVIDPLSEKRSDNSIQVALDDPRTRLLLIGGGKVCIKVGGNLPTALFHLSEVIDLGLDLEDAVLLGDAPSGPVVAVPFRVGEISATQDMEVVDLRSTYQNGLLSDDIVGALAQGSALLSWHQAHRFCGRCGAENEVRAGGYKRTCPACGTEHFPRTDPVAIMLIAKGDQCLLGRSFHFAPGMYSCLSGFIEPGETIEAAVRRETFEESGIRIGDVRYVSSQPWPFPYSLMIGCIAEALTEEIAADTTELEDCRWFSRTEVRQMLDGTHPHGLRAATKGAIARQLIGRWTDSA